MNERIIEAQKALSGVLVHFMSRNQRRILKSILLGEEGESIAETVLRTVKIIEDMPMSHQTDGQGDNAIVYLHYFMGSVDAWITERDMGNEGPTPWLNTAIGEQIQAFGKVNLYGTGAADAELGYVCIQELIEAGVELDLYWTPKPLKEVK